MCWRPTDGLGGYWHGPEASPPGEGTIVETDSGPFTKTEGLTTKVWHQCLHKHWDLCPFPLWRQMFAIIWVSAMGKRVFTLPFCSNTRYYFAYNNIFQGILVEVLWLPYAYWSNWRTKLGIRFWTLSFTRCMLMLWIRVTWRIQTAYGWRP